MKPYKPSLFTIRPINKISSTHFANVTGLIEKFEPMAREYMGEKLFKKIESAQNFLFSPNPKRQTGSNVDAASSIVKKLTTKEIKIVSEVYTTFFHLLNISELVDIILANRRRAQSGVRKASIFHAVEKLAAIGTSSEEMQSILDKMKIEPTFTAHPTEAKRPSTVRKIHKIGDELLKGAASDTDEIRNLIASLFATPEHRAEAPSVFDEVRYGIGITMESLWTAVPSICDDLVKALAQNFPGATFRIPTLLRFRSWVGGDRDGNPKVTAAVTERTIEYHREAALELQTRSIKELYDCRLLVLDEKKVPASTELLHSLKEDFFIVGEKARPDDKVLPHHAKARLIFRKMQLLRMGQISPEDYTIDHFQGDLRIIRKSLQQSSAGSMAAQTRSFRHCYVRAKVFGFHLQTLDLRQHTVIHGNAVEEIRKALPQKLRKKSIEELLSLENISSSIDIKRLSDPTKETLMVFKVAKEAIRRDRNSIACCIMSMTRSASDFLNTLFLMKIAGLWRVVSKNRAGKILAVESDLDIVPLFETIKDLSQAQSTLESALKKDVYRLQLRARRNHQEIMLGYSDSNKDGGYFMANMQLHVGMDRIAQVLKKHKVEFSFFHGRGGTVARGGGRAHDAILAMPENARSYRIRMTEQGEVISTRYGVPEIAHRHLEQIINGTMLINLKSKAAPVRNATVARKALAVTLEIAKTSKREYRSLVDAKVFWKDYQLITPISFLGRLNNASRPIFRGVAKGISQLEDLRAIPWVFSWNQPRLCIPGWYGLGGGLSRYLKNAPHRKNRLSALQKAYQHWPFFTLVINNARRELARTRLEIGSRYLDLGKNRAFLKDSISKDYSNAVQCILDITKSKSLLGIEPVIEKLIPFRNQYTDLLNLCQISLLERDRNKQDVTRAMLHVTSGLVAAMQSSG